MINFLSLSSCRTLLLACAACGTVIVGASAHAQAAMGGTNAAPMTVNMQPLKKYNVTVRRFNLNQPAKGEQFVLPVDSPDAEHAISAAMSNAVAFTVKSSGSSVLPVAFTCVGIAERQ